MSVYLHVQIRCDHPGCTQAFEAVCEEKGMALGYPQPSPPGWRFGGPKTRLDRGTLCPLHVQSLGPQQGIGVLGDAPTTNPILRWFGWGP